MYISSVHPIHICRHRFNGTTQTHTHTQISFNASVSSNTQKTGFVALAAGMLISLLFGFVFGLIVGATDQPWGLGDFPTDEMRGRYVYTFPFEQFSRIFFLFVCSCSFVFRNVVVDVVHCSCIFPFEFL